MSEPQEELRMALLAENTRLKEALGIIAARPEPAPCAVPITARNVARAALALSKPRNTR